MLKKTLFKKPKGVQAAEGVQTGRDNVLDGVLERAKFDKDE